MLYLSTALLLAAVPAAPDKADTAADLAPPVKLMAAGKPIDVEIGHAAPCVADFNGDGKPDLLVGQFGDGKLRIYLNGGTKEKPSFEKFDWFQAGGEVGKVPTG